MPVCKVAISRSRQRDGKFFVLSCQVVLSNQLQGTCPPARLSNDRTAPRRSSQSPRKALEVEYPSRCNRHNRLFLEKGRVVDGKLQQVRVATDPFPEPQLRKILRIAQAIALAIAPIEAAYHLKRDHPSALSLARLGPDYWCLSASNKLVIFLAMLHSPFV